MATERTFDTAAANDLLPEVKRLCGQIAELSAAVPELQDKLRISEYKAGTGRSSNDEIERIQATADALRASQDDLEVALVTLSAMGVRLKDPHQGLVDFLAYRDGELVELCWKLGEPAIAYWHRLGEGYPGRRPL